MVMNNYFQCALASIILVALRSLFLQFLDLPKIFKTSAYDGVSFCLFWCWRCWIFGQGV